MDLPHGPDAIPANEETERAADDRPPLDGGDDLVEPISIRLGGQLEIVNHDEHLVQKVVLLRQGQQEEGCIELFDLPKGDEWDPERNG